MNETIKKHVSILGALLAKEDPKYPRVQFDAKLLSLAKDCLARQAGVPVEIIADHAADTVVMC